MFVQPPIGESQGGDVAQAPNDTGVQGRQGEDSDKQYIEVPHTGVRRTVADAPRDEGILSKEARVRQDMWLPL